MEFKFKVGDVVRHVADADLTEDKRMPWGDADEPVRLCVVARAIVEGDEEDRGTYYWCRRVSRKGYVWQDLVKLTEIELVLSQPFSADESPVRDALKKLAE